MGYNTCYSLKIVKCNGYQDKEIRELLLKKLKEYDILDYALDSKLRTQEPVKWYEPGGYFTFGNGTHEFFTIDTEDHSDDEDDICWECGNHEYKCSCNDYEEDNEEDRDDE